MTPTKLVVMGAGGFGQEIVWAAKNANRVHPRFEIVGFSDDKADLKGKLIYGYPVLGTPAETQAQFSEPLSFVCAIGQNQVRIRVVERLLALGWQPVTVIDPSVIAAEYVVVGEGSYIGAGCILSPNAQIGAHVIINHHCSIGHDSVIQDYAQCAPGTRISGSCRIGRGAFLGSNSVVAPGRTVGDFATVGAASFAVSNIKPGSTVVGVPARTLLTSGG